MGESLKASLDDTVLPLSQPITTVDLSILAIKGRNRDRNMADMVDIDMVDMNKDRGVRLQLDGQDTELEHKENDVNEKRFLGDDDDGFEDEDEVEVEAEA